jgi:hypothetical protein
MYDAQKADHSSVVMRFAYSDPSGLSGRVTIGARISLWWCLMMIGFILVGQLTIKGITYRERGTTGQYSVHGEP